MPQPNRPIERKQSKPAAAPASSPLKPRGGRRARRRLVPVPPPRPAEASGAGPSPSLCSPAAAARDSGPDCRELAGALPLPAVRRRRRCWYGSSLLDSGEPLFVSFAGEYDFWRSSVRRRCVGFRVLIGGRTGPIAVEPNLGCWWQLTEGVPRHGLERRRRLSSAGARPGAQAAVAIALELPLLASASHQVSSKLFLPFELNFNTIDLRSDYVHYPVK